MSTPLSQARSLPRFAEAAVERARLTVVPRRVQKAPRVPFVSLVSLLLVGGIAGLLLFNTSMQQASFVATSMEQQAAVLAGKEESLRMELHRLRDPQRVAARAKQLGMVPATDPAFIRLSDGEVLGKATPAAPTNTMRIEPLPPAKPESLRPRMVILEAPQAPGARRSGAENRGDTARRSGRASRERADRARTNDRSEERRAPRSRGRTR
ncbi:MAG TPA: hypothetical protein VK964_04305 [Nocardioidaceae bacterium]|jgi:hypothetical protein|nr:hypothetical protein [Nocardioidaceae bacterium]